MVQKSGVHSPVEVGSFFPLVTGFFYIQMVVGNGTFWSITSMSTASRKWITEVVRRRPTFCNMHQLAQVTMKTGSKWGSNCRRKWEEPCLLGLFLWFMFGSAVLLIFVCVKVPLNGFTSLCNVYSNIYHVIIYTSYNFYSLTNVSPWTFFWRLPVGTNVSQSWMKSPVVSGTIPMMDPWDERYIYLHEWLIFMLN